MRKAFTRVRRRQLGTRGVSALEFALVAPIVLMTLFFTLEIGLLMMTDATLTRVSGEISRSLQVYRGDDGVDCGSYVHQRLKQGMHPLVKEGFFVRRESVHSPGEQAISVEAAEQCSDLGAGELAIFTVGFERPGFTGILGTLGIRIMHFERRLVVQNEI